MVFSECIVIIKDIVIALAAVTTIYVAINGLNKWKRELRGKVHFDAAKDLIRAVYKYRDEMSYARNMFITPNEFPEDYDIWNKTPNREGDAYAYVYQNRVKPLVKAAQDLDLYSLEAEALWGKTIKDRTIKLRRTFFRLQRSMQSNVQNIYSGHENLRTELKFKKEITDDINESTNGDDELSKEIKQAIEDIEKIVRPHLDKNS